MFQPLIGKHGRSDGRVMRPKDIVVKFQPLKGKHGRSDVTVVDELPGIDCVSTPQRKTRPF